MKKSLFAAIIAITAVCEITTLFSCSGLVSPSVPDNAPESSKQEQGYSLRGTFCLGNVTAVPRQTIDSPETGNRNAIPIISALTYSVTARRSSDNALVYGELSTDNKEFFFNNTLTAGTWQITAYAKQDESTILQSEPKAVTLDPSSPYATESLFLIPGPGNGTVNLTISWETGSGIGYCTYESSIPSLSSGNSGADPAPSLNIQADTVATGTYELTLKFYKDASSVANSIPLYSCTEYVAVYPRLSTNSWVAGSAPHVSGTSFNVTEDCVKTFVYRKVYVSASGYPAGEATGTSERPFNTMEAAMARLTEVVSSLNSTMAINESNPWELHVIGTITASSIAPSSKAFIDVPSSIGFLKIVGEGSGATLDANEKGRVLYVANGANVTIQNITLQKGKVTGEGNYGGGVFVKNGGSFTIKSGSITGCSSYRGGGIYTENIVKIEGGTISGNSADTNGGGLFVLSSGKVSITGGTITGNSASDNANNILIGNCNSASSFPDGNDSFYDDTSTTNANGKADAISVFSGKMFARFNKPASNGESSNLAQIADDFYFDENAGTIYLGNTTDTTGKTWVIGEQIQPKGALTIACPSTASTVKATIKPASSFSNYQIINHNKNNDITLKKIILDGNNSVRCISNSSGSLTMQSCTLTKGGGYTTGAGLYISGGSASVDTSSSITACDNSSITSSQGGGVYISGASTSLTLEGTISGCKSKKGGGIYLKNGTVTLKDNALIGQNATGTNYPTSIENGSNKATELGAGVYIEGGTFTMEGSSKISYNYASNSSGGIYIEAGTANIGSSSYTSPSVCNNGSDTGKTGGIYIAGSGTVYLYGSAKANSLYDVSVNSNRLYMEGSAIAQKVSADIGSSWIYAKNLTATTAATIIPASNNYNTSYQVIYPIGSSNLAAACAKFAVADDADGNKWCVNADGHLCRLLQPDTSAVTITDPSQPWVVTSSNSKEITLKLQNTFNLTFDVTLRNLNKQFESDCSALYIQNTSPPSPSVPLVLMDVNLILEGDNTLIGSHHGGIQLKSNSNTEIKLTFDTKTTATLTFDGKPGTDGVEPTSLCVESGGPTIGIASGLTFSGSIGSTTYTNATAFFTAARSTTQSCTFTITRS